MAGKLVFFTAEFPFGNKAEAFIENEIRFLAQKFSRVLVLPSFRESSKVRNLPPGAELNTFLSDQSRPALLPIFRKHFFRILFTFLYEASNPSNLFNYIRNWKHYIGFICFQINKYELLKQMLQKGIISADDTYYDFWYMNSGLALSFLKKDEIINDFVLRAHRYDLYDDGSEWGRVPFRKFIYNYTSQIAFSNQHGKAYFLSKIPAADTHKLSVHYLGVPYHDIGAAHKQAHNGFTIVSCSGVSLRKRVHRIPHVLSKLEHKITWVHFGTGDMMQELEDICKKLPSTITCILKGQVDNREIIEFYRSNQVDLFISFPLSEGLPVSMKEAISFGIPILSTNVCGIPDIVTPVSGRLVDVDESIDSIAKKLDEIIRTHPFDKEKIKKNFRENFLADTVYPRFIHEVLLKKKPQ